MKPCTMLVALGLLLGAGSALAGTADPGVNARQAAQHGRIAQGVASGDLTPGETHRLAVEQRGIRAEERSFKSDGKLTRAERRHLQRDLDVASRDIHRQKHDAQHR